MVVKRIISDEKKSKIAGSKVHKGKTFTALTQVEKDDLLKILAEQAGIL